MRYVIKEAGTLEEAQSCRELAALVYGFDESAGPIEGWPERWLMGVAEGRLVATVGMRARESCAHWFCGAEATYLAEALRGLGARDLAELCYLSVDRALRGFRFGPLLFSAAYSRNFLAQPGAPLPAVLHVATHEAFQALGRVTGVKPRPIPGLERGSGGRPELRVLMPDRDVPPSILDLPLPHEIASRNRRQVKMLGHE